MKRRYFFPDLAAHTVLAAASGSFASSLAFQRPALGMGWKQSAGESFAASSDKRNPLKAIGNRSIEEIRGIFHHELFDITIPLWNRVGVDWECGGYLPHLDEDGLPVTTNKQMYYQGRVLWLYSYFYNHFGKDSYHLEAAENGFDFLVRYCVDENCDWFTEVTRDGRPVVKFFDIYATIFTILGLGEYYRATGDMHALDLAVRSTYRVAEIVLSPHYQAEGHGPWYEPGTKRLGTWLHILSVVTPLLRFAPDPGIEKIAKMCVRNILDYHWQPKHGFAFETLRPDFTPYPDDFLVDAEERGYQNQARWVNNFHTMEAAWMIMDEALRVGNREMFTAGMEFGRSHLEKYWVVRGEDQGIVQFLRPDDSDPLEGREICKPYVFREIFILLLLALEHRRDKWASVWFDRAFGYAVDKPLAWPWMDTLHQPRGVMFCLEILDRIIARNGIRSDFFDNA